MQYSAKVVDHLGLIAGMVEELGIVETIDKGATCQIVKSYLVINHKIDNKCNHIQGFDFKMEELPKAQQTYYIKLFASKICSVKLFSLIDMTMDQLFNSWKTFIIYVYNMCM